MADAGNVHYILYQLRAHLACLEYYKWENRSDKNKKTLKAGNVIRLSGCSLFKYHNF